MYDVRISISFEAKETINESIYYKFIIKKCPSIGNSQGLQHTSNISAEPKDLLIPLGLFCKAFPFHFIFDTKLTITQLGSGKHNTTNT